MTDNKQAGSVKQRKITDVAYFPQRKLIVDSRNHISAGSCT